jgi:ribosomal protein S18
LKEREFICDRCKGNFKTHHNNQKYCPVCKHKVTEEYYKEYRKVYNATRRFNTEIKKRHYTRTKLKNQSRLEVDEVVQYCRENHNKVEGCLNCIAKDCIQPESSDEFLIWEQEGFKEEKYLEN